MEATEQKTATPINRFAAWVHVGPDSENCDGVTETDSECSNPLHFHAWVRLPNQLAHREIREKALAGKARRVRQLRESDSDVGIVLEDELDRMARQGDAAKPPIVDELLARDMWRDMTDARYEVIRKDEEQDSPRYIHIDRDRDRYLDLHAKAVEDRTNAETEEFTELESHLERWDAELREAIDAIVDPKRQALLDLDINALLDQLRDQRIDVESNETYLNVYQVNVWQTSTFKKPGGDLWFGEGDLEQAAPEVLDALKAAFEDLEAQERGDANP